MAIHRNISDRLSSSQPINVLPAFLASDPAEYIENWDPQGASNVVYACGKLHSNGVAPTPNTRLGQLQIAIVV